MPATAKVLGQSDLHHAFGGIGGIAERIDG